MEKEITQQIQIHFRGYKVFLVNLSQVDIDELVYSTFSILSLDHEIITSETPYFQIKNIPAAHAVHLETLDGMEDGVIYYQLNILKSKEFNFDGQLNLDTKKKSGISTPPPTADCPIKKIRTDKSSILKI